MWVKFHLGTLSDSRTSKRHRCCCHRLPAAHSPPPPRSRGSAAAAAGRAATRGGTPAAVTIRADRGTCDWAVGSRGLSRSIAVGGGALAYFGRRRQRAEAPPSPAEAIDRRQRRGVTVKLSAAELYFSYFQQPYYTVCRVCLFVMKMSKQYVSI